MYDDQQQAPEGGLPAGDPLAGAVRITSDAEITELLGTPHPVVIDKVRPDIGEFERLWLAHSPFCMIATSAADGSCDVSPRGDPPGFAQVLDPTTVVIPDRPGNRRADGWRNVLANPRVGTVFMVPGLGEVLRINGTAELVRDAPFFERLALDGVLPRLALVIRTQEVYFHCSRALTRGGVWRPESWAPEALPPRPPTRPRGEERQAAPARPTGQDRLASAK
ncbi:MSMEG_1061 family FMN-dependent PPOX-type flavoprotein [Streptomyces johnsoniae]|uniref:Pyridoxamine 5'-phosphate oxidase family protein n=1 Tax=Streptomyces johnsoniae TaxID=3075532 RepID=A0ABU2SC79_9ACTN|nr:MSMEG_1061 family FMN-dependent PPOX-type flavoprotein [Streptomyces sp. DSM 41886]MDT0446577.1 pyridoxamine 5'-phosphate oxidase family protein [Streptomyces sp. DSM 41886]